MDIYMEIVKEHLKRITEERDKYKGMAIGIGHGNTKEPIIVIVFSAFAIEAAMNMFLSLPRLYFEETNLNEIFLNLKGNSFWKKLQAISVICRDICDVTIEEKTIMDIHELRNELVHVKQKQNRLGNKRDSSCTEIIVNLENKRCLEVNTLSDDQIWKVPEYVKITEDFLEQLEICQNRIREEYKNGRVSELQ
jgi:hypothetical protein